MKGIYIYNADAFKSRETFSAQVTYLMGETEDIGKAAYDAQTDRLVLKMTKEVCIPAVSVITLTKLSE